MGFKNYSLTVDFIKIHIKRCSCNVLSKLPNKMYAVFRSLVCILQFFIIQLGENIKQKLLLRSEQLSLASNSVSQNDASIIKKRIGFGAFVETACAQPTSELCSARFTEFEIAT